MAANKQSDWPDDSQGVIRHPDRAGVLRPHRMPARTFAPAPDIADVETTRLVRPRPSLTPTRGQREHGKQEYELELRMDLLHGGYHVMHALLGADGGGVIKREDASLDSSPLARKLTYTNVKAEFNLAFEEAIQLACCAFDANGISPHDAGRLIEQILRDLAAQTPPAQRGE